VKRVDLILRGLAKAGRMRGDQKIEWVHFGHGPMKEKILDLIKNVPSNVSVVLRGYTPNLMNFYGNNTVDVFINVSEYEGTPVSIMEAIACGIPIIATAVGGNVEIVSNRNGIYLPPDLTSAHIANALIKFIDLHYKSNLLREGSREVWNEKYNAESNFRDFTYTISSIFKVDTYDY
jgi:glycosyltransferase involved in cell wall biosynthesis